MQVKLVQILTTSVITGSKWLALSGSGFSLESEVLLSECVHLCMCRSRTHTQSNTPSLYAPRPPQLATVAKAASDLRQQVTDVVWLT